MAKPETVPHRAWMDDLRSSDKDRQNRAFESLVEATRNAPVAWAYEVWDDLLATLTDGDNRQRSIAAQVLCNLSASDPKSRMVKDVGALLAVTKDERFVTARHCLQAIWKVGAAGEPQRKVLLKGLAVRFKECISEKNCTLIRYDILVALRRLYDAVRDERIRSLAEELMPLEEDLKYRKKYSAVWRK